jgi:3',5'-cyclic AMP phosphodiesterase CpdA
MFRLAHLSDPHVPPLPQPRIGELMNKRLLGYLSWQYRRKAIHRTDMLDRLTENLKSKQPDHVVVTGDLVNISLPGEFEMAADWLRRLGTPDRVTVVPGNHDAYVALPFFRIRRFPPGSPARTCGRGGHLERPADRPGHGDRETRRLSSERTRAPAAPPRARRAVPRGARAPSAAR